MNEETIKVLGMLDNGSEINVYLEAVDNRITELEDTIEVLYERIGTLAENAISMAQLIGKLTNDG